MKIVFFGTPHYSLPILEKLHKAFKDHGETPIEAVVTQSPKPVGRKQQLEYSAVDKWAHDKKIPIFFDAMEIIKNDINADVGILASYGQMIPSKVINYFPKGILVIHPSLLPEFRGSSPVPAMIITNSINVGCSIFKMDEKWDHGPVVTNFKDEILPDDTTQTLRDRLFERSADVLVQALPAYINGKITLKQQDHNKASFAMMIKKEDAFIEPKYLEKAISDKRMSSSLEIKFIKTNQNQNYNLVPSAHSLDLFIRAMSPWPGAWTNIQVDTTSKPKRLKLLSSHTEDSKLVLDEVQLEGKNPVSWEQFKKGYPNYKLQ